MWKFATLASLLALVAGGAAHAAGITTDVKSADFNRGTDGTASDVNSITTNETAGQAYVNNIQTTTVGAGGNTIEIAVFPLNSSSYQGRTGPTFGGTFNGQQVNAVVVLTGTTTAGSGIVQFSANNGRIGIFTTPAGTTFNKNQPNTWGATDPATGLVSVAPIATYSLITNPTNVRDPGAAQGPPANSGGGPGIFPNGASQYNFISVNPLAGQSALSGFFQFLLDQNPSTFQNAVQNQPLIPPGNTLVGQGLVVKSNSATIGNPFIDPGLAFGPGAPAFDALNTIAAALLGLPNLGGAHTAFATGFGTPSDGNPRDFSPSTAAGGSTINSADLFSTDGSNNSPTVLYTPTIVPPPVPEPASMLVWAIAIGSGCYAGIRRRLKGKK